MILPEPSKVMFAGDWHGNHNYAKHCVSHASYHGVDAIVHAGDFGWWLPGLSTHMFLRDVQDILDQCDINLYWVAGNHEFWPSILEWNEATDYQPWSDKRYPRITHLPNGYRWTWWNKTWLALGGAHSVDRLMRTEGKSWWPEEHISDADVERSIAGPVDIMVTHDCPSGVDIPGIPSNPEDDTRGHWPMEDLIASRDHRDKLAKVVDAVKPRMLIGGHYHQRFQGWRKESGTLINILDCDGSSIQDNTLILNRAES